MSIMSLMVKVAVGAASGAAFVTVLPVAGPVGAIAAAGAKVASMAGEVAIDHINENK